MGELGKPRPEVDRQQKQRCPFYKQVCGVETGEEEKGMVSVL